MATHKPFRELIKPGSNFEFVGRARVWALISLLLVGASIGMLFINKSWRGDYLNFSTDFKGGTELIFEFCAADTEEHVTVGSGQVRSALTAAGYDGFEVSDFSWEGFERCAKEGATEVEGLGEERKVTGILVRTPDFGALDAATAEQLRLGFADSMTKACLATPEAQEKKWTEKECTLDSAFWSGDRLFVNSPWPLDEKQVRDFFAAAEQTVKAGDNGWTATKEQGVESYHTEITISGLDRQYAAAIEKDLDGGSVARVVQSYGVGAKAGEQLRNDGIEAMFFAMVLIMIYLAFRFDIRYSPGAVAALLHDAIIVVGVFALTWTEFSLVTVAAILTVIGYSVNDTVVIFDRIRENAEKLKDKKLDRIVNISVNETLGRSLLTSMTTFLVTLMMNIFGVGLVENFAFAMNVGVIVGAYSSIFIAAPMFLWIDRTFYPSRGPVKPGDKARLKRKPQDEPDEPTDDELDEDAAEGAR